MQEPESEEAPWAISLRTGEEHLWAGVWVPHVGVKDGDSQMVSCLAAWPPLSLGALLCDTLSNWEV